MPINNTFNYQMDLNDNDDDTNDVIPFQEPSDPDTSEEPSTPEQFDLLNCVLKRHEEMKMEFWLCLQHLCELTHCIKFQISRFELYLELGPKFYKLIEILIIKTIYLIMMYYK